jgi:quinol-cytochrome oxidoreductase complex cytochrome b subunit
MRLLRQQLILVLNEHLIDYATPSTLSYFWSFGALSGLSLAIQLITGIFLAMHYSPHVDLAFHSVEHIMRDVNNGWLIRYVHANGASMFFIVVYCHIGRGLYYGSYVSPRGLLWCSGILIFFLMMATGFMGYVLPWGQMSFWGATVITNLFSAIPLIGESIAYWLWGGFSVDNATLNRFFSLHYLLPFIILGLVLLHLILLHLNGSSNPLGLVYSSDKIAFYPFFYVKDLFAFFSFILFFSIFVFFYPNLLGHPDNYIEANALVTPPHIVPEWYFLPFYAILRSIPDKLGGVVCMGFAIVSLAFLPVLNMTPIANARFRPLFKIFYWFFIVDVILLGWLGAKPVEAPYILLGQLATFYYFFFILILIPVLGKLEYSFIKYGIQRCIRNRTFYRNQATVNKKAYLVV